MSVWCQQQTHALQQRKLLFNNLVGAGEECRRQIKPNLLGRLCIDDELKLGRLKKGNFGGVLTCQNFCDLTSRVSKRFEQIDTVGHKTTRYCEIAERIHRWNSSIRGKTGQRLRIRIMVWLV